MFVFNSILLSDFQKRVKTSHVSYQNEHFGSIISFSRLLFFMSLILAAFIPIKVEIWTWLIPGQVLSGGKK